MRGANSTTAAASGAARLRQAISSLVLPPYLLGVVWLDSLAGWLPRCSWPSLMAVSFLLLNTHWHPSRPPVQTVRTLAGVTLVVSAGKERRSVLGMLAR